MGLEQLFRGVRTEALRWLKIATDTVNNLKFETKIKERDQRILEFVIIDVLNI